MKTMKTLLAIGIAFMLHCSLHAQNFNVPVPAGQDVRNLSGNICCFFRNNVATDDNGNAYVLSETLSDSSIWVTKYDINGNVVFNTRVGPPGYETNYHYRAKKIRVYDRVYVLCRMMGPLANPNYSEEETVFPLDKATGAVTPFYSHFIPYPGHT